MQSAVDVHELQRSGVQESGTLGDAVRALDAVPAEYLAEDLALISVSDDYGAV